MFSLDKDDLATVNCYNFKGCKVYQLQKLQGLKLNEPSFVHGVMSNDKLIGRFNEKNLVLKSATTTKDVVNNNRNML